MLEGASFDLKQEQNAIWAIICKAGMCLAPIFIGYQMFYGRGGKQSRKTSNSRRRNKKTRKNKTKKNKSV